MKAYVMHGPGVLELEDVDDPVLQEDEILLKTDAVSICSTDVSYFRGHLFPDAWPVLPGHEYVGTVMEVGRSHKAVVSPGDRVCYWGQTDFGGMAEYRAIRPIFGQGMAVETSWYTERNFYDSDQAAAVIVPPTIPIHRATIIEPLTSVLRSLLVNPPKPGDACVVLGCGPSALLAVQVLSRHFGVGSVTVVDRNDHRLKLALHLGAQLGFNTATQAVELEQFVRDQNDEFADYVFDALPHIAVDGNGKDVRELAMGLLRPGGMYVVYGASSVRQHISTWLILAKGLNIRAAPFDVRLFPMARSAHVAGVALRLIESGTIDAEIIVTNRRSFYEADAVREAFNSYGQGVDLKTSLTVGDATTDLVAAVSSETGYER